MRAPTAAATARVWKLINPLVRPLAGYAPWWVLLETVGRRTGEARLTPLASGPFDGSTISVLAGYGDDAAFVKNLRANPAVRIKRLGRWHSGTAELLDPVPTEVARLGRYARLVVLRMGSDPIIVKVTIRSAVARSR